MGRREAVGVRLHMLGRFEVRSGELTLIDASWRHSKAKALIKLLALQPNRSLHREQVLDTLWGHLKPKAAAANLRKNRHYLRSDLRNGSRPAELVESNGELLVLLPDVRLDIDEFRELGRQAHAMRTDTSLYEQALKLYEGELLPEDLYEEWTAGPRDELAALHAELLAELTQLYETTGRLELAKERADQLVRADPLNEESQRSLVRLLARTGDREGALRQLEACRKALREELGVEPAEETEALLQRITEGRLDDGPVVSVPALGPFVGRERELRELRGALDGALEGRGRTVLLAGEAGIGKTRLAHEVAAYAALRGARVLSGSAREDEGTPPYWPWIQILRSYVDQVDSHELAKQMGAGAPFLTQLVPEIRDRDPELPTPTGDLAPAQARFRLFDSVATLFKNAARRRAIVVVIDDLRFIDPSSLGLLEFLMRATSDAHMLIIAACRDNEASRRNGLAQFLSEIARLTNHERLTLDGLGNEDVASLLQLIAGEKANAKLVAALQRLTRGNPLFVSEVGKLIAAGSEAGHLDDVNLTDLGIPTQVVDVIGQRLSSLSQTSQRALAAASVVGNDFASSTLATVVEIQGDELLHAIDEGVRAAVVTEMGRGRYAFRHGLIQRALYDALPLSRRMELHRRTGEALEARSAAGGKVPLSQLAHHFREASLFGDAEKAIDYGERAARQASLALAYEDAIEEYERTLEVLDARSLDPTCRCELLLGLGDAQWRAGGHDRAATTLKEAASVARQLGDADRFARAALSFRGLAVVDEDRRALSEEALELLGECDSTLRARVLAGLARNLLAFPDSAERRARLSQEAVEMARRLGDDATLADVIEARHFAVAEPGNVVVRLDGLGEMIDAAQRAGETDLLITGHYWRVIDYLELGDMEHAEEDLGICRVLTEDFPQPYQQWRLRRLSATLALLRGEFDEGERLAADALQFGEEIQESYTAINFATQMGILRREQGRMAELEQTAIALAENYPTIPAIRSCVAWVYTEIGRRNEASEILTDLLPDDAEMIPKDILWMFAMALLAEVCAFLHDEPRAAVLYERLQPFALRCAVLGDGIACLGSVSRYLGLLAATMSSWTSAGEHFELALKVNRRLGAHPLVARTRHDYAGILLARGRPADRAKAAELLVEATAAARRMGMRGLEESAQMLAARAAGNKSPG